MTSLNLISVDQYLDGTSDFEPDAEFVDGVIEQRYVGEYDHSSWLQAIARWFQPHLADWNIRVRCSLRVQVSPTRYRIPDVVVFNRDHPIEHTLTLPPIAVFEVLSPEDRMAWMLKKHLHVCHITVEPDDHSIGSRQRPEEICAVVK